MILAARRRESATGSARAFRECFPGVTGVLDDVDDRRMIQVRMVSVAGDAERRTTDEGDVVRLRWVRRALPVLGDAVRVRELCHVRGGAVDVREVMVLEEDDDELVEVVDGIDGHGLRTRRITGSGNREEAPGREQKYDQEKGCDQCRGRVWSGRRTN